MSEQSPYNKKLTTWALVLSIVAIVLCLLTFALWIFETIPHSIVTPETFIGACVTLLGVIVAIAVGSQIVNVMEVKSAQRLYEEGLKTALEKIQRQQEQIDEEQHRNSVMHNYNLAKLMLDDMQLGRACFYYTCALYENIQLKTALGNEASILSDFRKCLLLNDGDWDIPQKMQNELKTADVLMHQHAHFHWIQSLYEPLRDEYFKKIGL